MGLPRNLGVDVEGEGVGVGTVNVRAVAGSIVVEVVSVSWREWREVRGRGRGSYSWV